MKKYRPFFLGMLVGTALTFVALRYHVIRHDEGVSLVPRHSQPELRSIYSDVREWGSAMWEQHPEVANALIANEQIDIISDESLDEVSQRVSETIRISGEKLQSMLSEYQTQRAAEAEIETTGVPVEQNHDGMTIGQFPPGLLQNSPPAAHVPIVDEPAQGHPAAQPQPPAQPWRNPFDFQPRRTGQPTVGSDQPEVSTTDAVALRSRDPWLREVAHADGQESSTSIPTSLAEERHEEDEPEDAGAWLPKVFSSLLADDGQSMHGAVGPSSIDLGPRAAPQSDLSELPATSIPVDTSIPEPEALREPLIPVRPF